MNYRRQLLLDLFERCLVILWVKFYMYRASVCLLINKKDFRCFVCLADC